MNKLSSNLSTKNSDHNNNIFSTKEYKYILSLTTHNDQQIKEQQHPQEHENIIKPVICIPNKFFQTEEIEIKAIGISQYKVFFDFLENLHHNKPEGIADVLSYKELKKQMKILVTAQKGLPFFQWKVSSTQQYYANLQKNWSRIIKGLIYLHNLNICLNTIENDDIIRCGEENSFNLGISLALIIKSLKDQNIIPLSKLDRVLVSIDNHEGLVFKNDISRINEILIWFDNANVEDSFENNNNHHYHFSKNNSQILPKTNENSLVRDPIRLEIQNIVKSIKKLFINQAQELYRVVYIFPKYNETNYHKFQNHLNDLLYKLSLPQNKDYPLKAHNLKVEYDIIEKEVITQRLKTKYRFDTVLSQPYLFKIIFNKKSFHHFLINLLKLLHTFYNDTQFDGKLTLDQIHFDSPDDISMIDIYIQWLYSTTKKFSNINIHNTEKPTITTYTRTHSNSLSSIPTFKIYQSSNNKAKRSNIKVQYNSLLNKPEEEHIILPIRINNKHSKVINNSQSRMITSFFAALHQELTSGFAELAYLYPIDLSCVLKYSWFRCEKPDDLRLFEKICSYIDLDYNSRVFEKYGLKVDNNTWEVSHILIENLYINPIQSHIDKRKVNSIFCQINPENFKEFMTLLAKYQAFLDYFVFFSFDSLDIHVLIFTLDLQSIFDMNLVQAIFANYNELVLCLLPQVKSSEKNIFDPILEKKITTDNNNNNTDLNTLPHQYENYSTKGNSKLTSHDINPKKFPCSMTDLKNKLHSDIKFEIDHQISSDKKQNSCITKPDLKIPLVTTKSELSSPLKDTNNNTLSSNAHTNIPKLKNMDNLGDILSLGLEITRYYILAIVYYASQLLQFWYYDCPMLMKSKSQTFILSKSCNGSNEDTWEDELDYLIFNIARMLNIHPYLTDNIINKIFEFFQGNGQGQEPIYLGSMKQLLYTGKKYTIDRGSKIIRNSQLIQDVIKIFQKLKLGNIFDSSFLSTNIIPNKPESLNILNLLSKSLSNTLILDDKESLTSLQSKTTESSTLNNLNIMMKTILPKENNGNNDPKAYKNHKNLYDLIKMTNSIIYQDIKPCQTSLNIHENVENMEYKTTNSPLRRNNGRSMSISRHKWEKESIFKDNNGGFDMYCETDRALSPTKNRSQTCIAKNKNLSEIDLKDISKKVSLDHHHHNSYIISANTLSDIEKPSLDCVNMGNNCICVKESNQKINTNQLKHIKAKMNIQVIRDPNMQASYKKKST